MNENNFQKQIEILKEQLSRLYQQGQYEQAIKTAERVRDLVSEVRGEEHPDFAESLNDLALLFYSNGYYTDAKALYQKAIDVYRKALGEGHPDFATALNNLALLYDAIGDYSQAETFYLQAIEIRRKTLGEDDPYVAQSLNNLAELYRTVGKYAQAEALYQQSRDIRRASLGDQHPDFAASLNNLAEFYRETANYAEAELLYKQAIEIYRSAFEDSHPDLASSLNNLAITYQMTGRYAEAEQLYLQALEIDRKSIGKNHPGYAIDLSNLARLYRVMGKYINAEALHLQAMDIDRKALGENHPGFGRDLNNLAELYSAMGEYTDAEPLYKQALKIQSSSVGEKHPNYAKSLSNLGALCMAIGNKEEAFNFLKKVEDIDNELIGQILSISSDNRRLLYLKNLQQNFDIFLSLILCCSNSTLNLDFYTEGLELVLRRKGLSAEASSVQREAVLSGRYPALKSKFKELTSLQMQIAQKALAGSGVEGLESHQKLLADWKMQREGLEAELVRAIPEMNLTQKLKTLNRQMIADALQKDAALVEFIRFNPFDFDAVPIHGDSQWKAARYLAFILLTNEVQVVDLGEAEPIEQLVTKFRESITGELEKRDLDRVLQELVQGTKRSKFSDLPSEISELLQEYGLSDVESIDVRNLTPVSMEIIRKVNESVGFALRKTVFDPLLEAINDRKRLFLAPDSDLTRLPFEALPLSENRLLIDEYYITYLSTGRDVLRFQAPTNSKPTEPLVFADPDFNLSGVGSTTATEKAELSERHSRDLDRGTLHFQRLSGTRLEGEQIADQLNVEPLLEGEVLETRLKTCRSPRILHLATHGFFLENQEHDLNLENPATRERLSGYGLENPLLRSGLALAGANTWLKKGLLPPEAEDGILTAEDVSGLDLLNTELVVLSACETGLGEVHTGEGVFGLRRAFVLAGAKRLVMSLWSVPDQQTQELMTDFYDRMLKRGQPCADALRDAQLEMRKKYSNPFYWGAFIFQGDPSRLSFERTGE